MFEIAPPVLYKFRYFDPDSRHLQTITQSSLWFACSRDFNDPFDMSFEYDFDGLHDELALQWARQALTRHEPNLSPAQREARAIEIVHKLRTNPQYVAQKKAEFVRYNQDTFGVCSLCASKSNLLLWAHYAHKHTGFCVGLSVDKLHETRMSLVPSRQLLDLHQVKYSQSYPAPNFFRCMINREDTQHIRDVIQTKSADWYYEQEWRLVFWDHANTSLDIGSDSILEITLGCRVSPENKKLMLNACHEHVPHARIFQAEKKEREFGLDFIPLSL